MLWEKSLVKDDLGPIAVYAPQNGHIADQYLADLDLLDVWATEFLPSSLGAEPDQQVLEKVAHAADHVINEVFLWHLDGSGDRSATDARDHALHVWLSLGAQVLRLDQHDDGLEEPRSAQSKPIAALVEDFKAIRDFKRAVP